MVGRCKRKVNTRKDFDLNTLWTRAEAEHLKRQNNSHTAEVLQLTFSGYFDKVLASRGENIEVQMADVEVSIVKICHKRRKDVSSAFKTVANGKTSVVCNPVAASDRMLGSSVSFSSDHFSLNGSNSVKSYVLKIQVSIRVSTGITGRSPHKGDVNSDLENQGPPRKKLRSSRDSGNSCKTSDDAVHDTDTVSVKTYSAELMIYDRRHRCLLTEADYELVLEEDVSPKLASHKQRTWETVTDGKDCIPFEIFTNGPIIKFGLSWKQPLASDVEGNHQQPLLTIDGNEVVQLNCVDNGLAEIKTVDRRSKDVTSPAKRKRIFYQFLYNNNMRQQTEARDNCQCPWCYLNCLCLSALLNHLRCCHSRFNFTFVDHPKGGRIDVSINDLYDGSYVGNPQDLVSHLGYAFGRNGPVRRMSMTHILVSKRAKPLSGLLDLLDSDGDCQRSRHSVQGHNRLYYHTLTCRPVRPSEIDVDSEEENYPVWLRQKTQNMIDEFTDVNEGEKEVMKMWNLHVMHHNYISDYQIPKACSTFIDEYGTEMFRRNLRRNFLLHLVNLCDFGLLRPSTLHRTMAKFFQLCNRLSEILRAVEVPSQSAVDGLGNSSVDRAAVAEPCCNQLTSSSSVVL